MGSAGCILAGLVEGSASFKSCNGMAAMLLGSIGGALGYPEGVIKPGKVVLAVLFGIVQCRAWVSPI